MHDPLDELKQGKNVYLISKHIDEGCRSLASYICSFIVNYKQTIRDNDLAIASKKMEGADDDDVEHKDQGFTRPVVLLLAPFRSSAYRMINEMIASSGFSTIRSRKRFVKEFGPDEEEVTAGPNENPLKDDSKSETEESDASDAESDTSEDVSDKEMSPPEMPFQGNVDDHFRMGVKIGINAISLYEKFYGSDLIVASPLSLRILIGSKGDTSKIHDHDFLSSIRLVVLVEADVIVMQNWDHLLHVIDHTNLFPKKSISTCNYSRVDPMFLEGKGKEMRQIAILTRYPTPEINAFWRTNSYRTSSIISVPHAYASPYKDTCRLKIYFSTKKEYLHSFENLFLSAISKLTKKHICILVPSYFDWVQLRSRLDDRKDISFKAISEYSTNGEITGARSSFFNGHTRLLVISERLLYFKRLRIRGIETLIFFGPPTDPSIYDHLVHYCMPIDTDATDDIHMVAVLPQDVLALERVVGPAPLAAFYSNDTPICVVDR